MKNASNLDDVHDLYSQIMSNVNLNVSLYEETSEDIPFENVEMEEQFFDASKEKIDQKLRKTALETRSRQENVYKIREWYQLIHNEQFFLDQIDENFKNAHQTSNIALTHYKTACDLKKLEKDLHNKILNILENSETPVAMRLKSITKNMRGELSRRRDTNKKLSQQLKAATEKFNENNSIHKKLTNEMVKLETQMARFKNKTSFELIEKAKRSQLMMNKFKETKKEINEQIFEAHREIDALKNHEKSQKELTKLLFQHESEYNRKKKEYEEIISGLNQDLMASHFTQTSAEQILVQEMLSAQNSHKNIETKLTNVEITKMSTAFARSLPKYTREKQSYKTKLEKELKKNNSTYENAISAFNCFASEDKSLLKQFMLQMTDELKIVLEEYHQIFIDKFVVDDNKAKKINKQKIELLTSQRQRILSKIAEKDIEIESNMSENVTLEGIIFDILESSMNANYSNQKFSDTSHKIRSEISTFDNFILKATKMNNELENVLRKYQNLNHNELPSNKKRSNSALSIRPKLDKSEDLDRLKEDHQLLISSDSSEPEIFPLQNIEEEKEEGQNDNIEDEKGAQIEVEKEIIHENEITEAEIPQEEEITNPYTEETKKEINNETNDQESKEEHMNKMIEIEPPQTKQVKFLKKKPPTPKIEDRSPRFTNRPPRNERKSYSFTKSDSSDTKIKESVFSNISKKQQNKEIICHNSNNSNNLASQICKMPPSSIPPEYAGKIKNKQKKNENKIKNLIPDCSPRFSERKVRIRSENNPNLSQYKFSIPTPSIPSTMNGKVANISIQNIPKIPVVVLDGHNESNFANFYESYKKNINKKVKVRNKSVPRKKAAKQNEKENDAPWLNQNDEIYFDQTKVAKIRGKLNFKKRRKEGLVTVKSWKPQKNEIREPKFSYDMESIG